MKYALYFLSGRTPRVGVVNLLTAQVKSTDLYSICLSCCCPRDQKQLLHRVTQQVSNDEECVYTVYDTSSCFATIFITCYVSLLLHVLKHRISKNVFLQNILTFSPQTQHFKQNLFCHQLLTLMSFQIH